MKIVIENKENRWLVNGKRYEDMSQAEREVLNTAFKEIKKEYVNDSMDRLRNLINKK